MQEQMQGQEEMQEADEEQEEMQEADEEQEEMQEPDEELIWNRGNKVYWGSDGCL